MSMLLSRKRTKFVIVENIQSYIGSTPWNKTQIQMKHSHHVLTKCRWELCQGRWDWDWMCRQDMLTDMLLSVWKSA